MHKFKVGDIAYKDDVPRTNTIYLVTHINGVMATLVALPKTINYYTFSCAIWGLQPVTRDLNEEEKVRVVKAKLRYL